MMILKQIFTALFLGIVFTGCSNPLLLDRVVYVGTDTPSPFDNPIFADYETYQAALQELDDIDSMRDHELEDLLFADNYETPPEFSPHIDHYMRLKEEFTGDSAIRSNVRVVMTDLENISTEADFIKFKNTDSLEGSSGLCHRMILSSRRPLRLIEIDYTFWILMSSLEERHTLFHELGHCDLDRKHEPDGARSLMVKKHYDLREYLTVQEFYQELFDPEKINNHKAGWVIRFKEYEERYFSRNR